MLHRPWGRDLTSEPTKPNLHIQRQTCNWILRKNEVYSTIRPRFSWFDWTWSKGSWRSPGSPRPPSRSKIQRRFQHHRRVTNCNRSGQREMPVEALLGDKLLEQRRGILDVLTGDAASHLRPGRPAISFTFGVTNLSPRPLQARRRSGFGGGTHF